MSEEPKRNDEIATTEDRLDILIFINSIPMIIGAAIVFFCGWFWFLGALVIYNLITWHVLGLSIKETIEDDTPNDE
jgi:hypothetical protein